MKPKKCPKCKGKIAGYTELMTATIDWTADDDGYATEDGFTRPGDATGVVAVCAECGHKWKLRKITQITELRKT